MTRTDVVHKVARYLMEEKDMGQGWFIYFTQYAQMLVDKQKAVILP